MKIVIAGGHGKIALRLGDLLVRGGDEVVGLVRDPDHVSALESLGVQGVPCDLEHVEVDEVAGRLAGADAAVFAAGAGPGSGVARKETVDRAAAVLFADAAERAGVRKFVQISAMGADLPVPSGLDEVWTAYITAKAQAEADLRARPGLDWTILRPGALTDEPGTGRVTLAEPPLPRGQVTRDDVAMVVAEILTLGAARHMTLELVNGDTSVPEAVRAVKLG